MVWPHFPTKDEMDNQIWVNEFHGIRPPKNNQSKPMDYSLLLKLLNKYDLETGIFSDSATTESVMHEINMLLPKLVSLILTRPIDSQLSNEIYDYLAGEDAPESTDAIFVHGSPDLHPRADVGIKLYKEGWSKKIIFSGSRPSTDRAKVDKPEAEMYRDYAIGNGIPISAIILENESITIPDNIRRSLLLFRKIKFKPKSLIVVIGNFAMRRAYAGWLKYTTKTRIVRRVAIPLGFERDKWFKNELAIKAFITEYFKLRLTQLFGDL